MDILTFIQRYEAILKEKKIPKMQFYKECKISDAAVSQWRTGKTEPSMKSIQQIADYLQTTIEYLLSGSGTKEKPATENGDGRNQAKNELDTAGWCDLNNANKEVVRGLIASLLKQQSSEEQ